MLRLGILSDTHGLLRPRVLERLAGCDRILHAGDVGDLQILQQLESIAPVDAVRGNVDLGHGLESLPSVVSGGAGDVTYRMIHQREQVPAVWQKEAQLILFGHSHRPELEWRGGVLWLNPGACGRRRFHLPLTVARVTLVGRRIVPEILSVDEDPGQELTS